MLYIFCHTHLKRETTEREGRRERQRNRKRDRQRDTHRGEETEKEGGDRGERRVFTSCLPHYTMPVSSLLSH